MERKTEVKTGDKVFIVINTYTHEKVEIATVDRITKTLIILKNKARFKKAYDAGYTEAIGVLTSNDLSPTLYIYNIDNKEAIQKHISYRYSILEKNLNDILQKRIKKLDFMSKYNLLGVLDPDKLNGVKWEVKDSGKGKKS